MSDLLGGLLAIIVEALTKFFTSSVFVKVLIATFTYCFLFVIIPLLVKFLVPSTIMGALDGYMTMLQGGLDQVVCSGSSTPVSGNSVSCSAVVQMAQFGQGIAYILQWFQFGAALQAFLPAMAVSFLFKRI